MKRAFDSRKKFCCALLVAVLMATSTGSVFATTRQTAGQASLKNIGVDISWYDLGAKYKYYYISDDYGTDFYQLNMSNDTETKTCFVNGKGEEVLPLGVYNIATSGSGNDAIVVAQKDGIAYKISKDKMQTMDMSAYSEIKEFDNEYMTVRLKSSNRVAITDWNGKLLFEDKSGVYQNLRFVCDGVFLGQMPNNNYQLLDSQGNLLTEMVYGDIWGVSENLIRVQSLENKWGFVDVTGKEIIPMIYEDLIQFREGVVGAKKDGKWGVIDKENQVLIPFVYDSVTPCYDGVLAVEQSGNMGCLTRQVTLCCR